ncbi:uncharacterized protein LOC144625717 [Crassostrea virginica]
MPKGHCQKCNKVLEGKFCIDCGNELVPTEVGLVPDGYCTICKSQRPGKHCYECGNELEAKENEKEKDPEKKKEKAPKFVQNVEIEIVVHPNCITSSKCDIGIYLPNQDKYVPLECVETTECFLHQRKFTKMRLNGTIPMMERKERYLFTYKNKQIIEHENRPNDSERILELKTGVAFLLDGFLLPVDRRGFLGLFGIGKVKQEDIDLLAQVTVCSFLSIKDQIRDSQQRSYYEIKQHIDQTLHVLANRAFEAFKIPIGTAIVKYIESVCLMEDTCHKGIFFAVLAIDISHEYRCNLSEPTREQLKKMLQLHKVEDNSCPNWIFLKEKLKSRAREGICKRLVQFLETDITNQNVKTLIFDPSWMLAIPLLHLLSGMVKEFEEENEQFDLHSWWGKLPFSKDNIIQVARRCKWKTKPTNIVEKMWKLRHVDRKVLRTFSMHLSLKSLQEMTELGWIDVTLLTANLLRIAMDTSEKAIIYDKNYEKCVKYAVRLLEDSNANYLINKGSQQK